MPLLKLNLNQFLKVNQLFNKTKTVTKSKSTSQLKIILKVNHQFY